MATTPIALFAQTELPILQSIADAVTAVAAGVTALDALITTLQNSPGTITPADQATLDQMQTQSKAILAQIQALNTAPPGQVVPAP